MNPKTAKKVYKIFSKNTTQGYEVKTQHKRLEIGDMCGTVYITENGKYIKEYNSGFYGFANDNQGHKYTFGLSVIHH